MAKPLDRYLALNHLIERLSYYSGFNPFAPTWKFDRHRNIHLLNIAMGFLTTFSCMYIADEGIEKVKISFSLGIFCQTLTKAVLLIHGADYYQELVAQIEMLYRSKNRKTQEVMAGKVDLSEKVFKVVSFVNSSAVLIFILYPWVMIIFTHELNLMFPFYIPIFDPQSYIGFGSTYIFHCVLLIYTLLFHNAFDIAFINFTVHAIAMVDLIKIDYEELAEFTENCNADNESDMKTIRQKLKGIIEAQREFDTYVSNINSHYTWACFMTSSTSIFSVCIALVLILIIKWPLAYGLCWALFGQLFCCYMNGEVINHQYVRLSRFLYDLPWHKFGVSEKKMMVLMLQKASRPNLMDILFTGSLNLETFATICNMIYSYYNVCESFLKT